MSQTKAQLLDNIKDNVQLDARNSLRFADTDSSHYVAFKAPATVSSNVTWTLPAADGSANYVLATDGSGTLSWIADPAGQWTTSGSNIYFTGGNVGIGDSSPSNPLSVTGASAFNGDVQFTGASYNVTWDKSADDLIFADNAAAHFGTGNDLRVYHTGSHSYIENTNGDLIINGDIIRLKGGGNNETLLTAVKDGAVELYYDNTKRVETNQWGARVTGSLWTDALYLDDNEKITLGTGSDLEIYTTGSNSVIAHNGDGDLIISTAAGEKIYFDSSEFNFRNAASNETLIKATENGAVELYHDNVKTFATEDNGAYIYGPEGGIAQLMLYADEGDDNPDKWRMAVSASASQFNLYNFNDGAWETSIEANGSGNVELYYDNSKKLETMNGGVSVEGQLAVVGSGVSLSLQDQGKLALGQGDDCKIYHSGSHAFIDNDTGNLNLQSPGSIYLLNDDGSENLLKAVPNGAVELYYDNAKTFETISGGATVTGQLYVTAELNLINGSTNAHRYIDAGLGDDNTLFIRGTSGGDASHETLAEFTRNGAVSLFYNNTKKFETKDEGARVHGVIEAFPSSTSAVTAGMFYNNSTGASADCRVQIKTYSNEGADPYIHFDAGGTNMIAGMRYGGTTTNMLVLGRGENPQADTQILLRGDGDIMFGTNGNSAESNSGFYMNASGDCANSTDNGYLCIRRRGGSTTECQKFAGLNGYARVMGDGDLENTNNSYGSLSDVNLKQDIVDAGSQWADIKALRVRKYRFKANPSGPLQIGVVAQEVETVSPGLVKDDLTDSRPGSTDTSTTKAVKYSILYMKAIKALQEAMTRIETLETKVAALESA